MLFDQPIAWLPVNDPFDIRRLVTSGDDESSGVLADPLVLSERERPNPLQTSWIRTLTNQAVD